MRKGKTISQVMTFYRSQGHIGSMYIIISLRLTNVIEFKLELKVIISNDSRSLMSEQLLFCKMTK